MTLTSLRPRLIGLVSTTLVTLVTLVTLSACSGDPNAIECANGIFCPEGTQCAAVQPVCLTNPCGNGIVDVGEICDDGNIMDGDGCSADCKSREGCGDGVLNAAAGELCDDRNTTAGDGCAPNCRSLEVCGNGIKDVSEPCDDGDNLSGNGCDTNCTITACGNTIVAGAEGCDDGNAVDGDGCDNNCRPTGCGNSLVTAPEVCDDGNATNGDGCDNNCRPSGCGNTIVTGSEVCDDGNTANGDGCSATCLSNETCGNSSTDIKNGAVGVAEVCDDGNTTSGDGCAANCLSAEICGNAIRDINEACDDGDPLGGPCSPDCQTAAGCGDGAPDPGEECDDANGINTDDCRNDCRRVKCGDGVTAATATGGFAEQCDGGTTGTAVETTTCNLDCTTRSCGDGKVNQTAGERCDDTNLTNNDGCDNNCTITACGNAVTAGTEQCDDGNLVSNDGCDANCKLPACRNGIVNPGEACDDGNATNGDGCDFNCTVTACGNGIATAGEQCDDGNPTNGDGCDVNCKITACGNAIITSPEVCDDGNTINADGCDSNCTVTACGNGVITGTEACDDGNAVNGDGCDNNCRVTACGNLIITGTEACDDGNLVNGDACDSNCTFPACGNGVKAGTEACDDGNLVSGDGCDANCTFTACRNNIVTAGEECDDGNSTTTDNCTNTCRFPTCGDTIVRTTSPAEQCDDGNAVTEACAYGAASCTVCNSTCQNQAGSTTSCGDGIRQVANETCDDGNATCGTCSATCQAFSSAKATGSMTIIKEADLDDDDAFTLSDGINPPVTFEYNPSPGNGVVAPRIAINLVNNDTATTVRTKTRDAINAVAGSLEIIATDGTGSTLILTHERFSNVGNVAITETVTDTSFGVSGMSGGAGGDCATAATCRTNADCLSGNCSGNVCAGSGVTIAITAGPPNPTNDATPTVSFTAGGGAISTACQVDSGAFTPCTSPFTSGALTDGNHSITVRATDAGTNTATDTTGTFVVDTIGPIVTLLVVPPDPTNVNTPTVSFMSPDAPSFTCQIDGGAQNACSSPFTAPTLADGAHTIAVRGGTDTAGNVGAATTTAFTIDTAPPTVTITGGPDNGFPTGDNVQTFTFTATGATGTTCKVDAGAAGACTSPFVTGSLTAGIHTITITASDAAGNSANDVATNDLDPTVMCLDGATDRGDTAVTGLVENLGAATVEFWFRGLTMMTTYELVDFDIPAQYPLSAGDSSVDIAYALTGSLVVTVRTPVGPVNVRTFTPAVGYTVTDWHHYAVVFTAATLRLFVDGVEATAVQTSGTQDKGFDDAFGGLGAAIEMHVGVNGDTVNSAFAAGGLLDLRVSSIARYATGFTPTYPQTTPVSTLLLYPLDEGAGLESFEVLNPALHSVAWQDAGWAVCF